MAPSSSEASPGPVQAAEMPKGAGLNGVCLGRRLYSAETVLRMTP
jgi:hypothetical protein